ncbi:MAG TPA: hypothetical protein ENO20_01040 [Bacteroides sp.]|nr:hypothetical protein [Bacteroides sp.]
MHLFKKYRYLFLACLMTAGIPVSAQNGIDLAFQGMLSDVHGNRISNEQFNLSVRVLSVPGSDLLWQSQSVVETDDEGWFGFSIPSISRYLGTNGRMEVPVIIRMEFLSGAGSGWISQGDEFTVTYTLAPVLIDQTTQLTITRMEGSDLMVHSEEHLYAFKDQYPFAYLTGGFILTDEPPVSTAAIQDLKEWLCPPEQMVPGSSSRGVKGGFPVGGYRKKN